MKPESADRCVEGLVTRAHDVDRFLSLYRAELSRIPVEQAEGDSSVRNATVAELSVLLCIVEDVWRTVSERTARLHEEARSRTAAAQVEQELDRQGEKWQRYLSFAEAAGIRVPVPAH